MTHVGAETGVGLFCIFGFRHRQPFFDLDLTSHPPRGDRASGQRPSIPAEAPGVQGLCGGADTENWL